MFLDAGLTEEAKRRENRVLTQETQSQQQEEIHQLWLRCGGDPQNEETKEKRLTFLNAILVTHL